MGPLEETNSMLAGGTDFGSPPSPSGDSSGWEKALGIGTNILGTMFPWLGTLYNVWQQNKTNKNNREFAMQMAEFQNQMNLAQWQRETQYNSPLEQMQRLKDAGLNPDLIYSSGGIQGSNVAASSPSLNMPDEYFGAVAPQVDPMLTAQVRNLNANASLTESKIPLTDAQIKSLYKGMKVSDEQIKEIRASAELLSQQWRTNEFIALINEIKSDVIKKGSREYSSIVITRGPDGKEDISEPYYWNRSYRDIIEDSFGNEIEASRRQFEYAAEDFQKRLDALNRVEDLRGYNPYININDIKSEELKKLISFNKFADILFQGEASQASVAAAIAALDLGFYQTTGWSPAEMGLYETAGGAAVGLLKSALGRSAKKKVAKIAADGKVTSAMLKKPSTYNIYSTHIHK